VRVFSFVIYRRVRREMLQSTQKLIVSWLPGRTLIPRNLVYCWVFFISLTKSSRIRIWWISKNSIRARTAASGRLTAGRDSIGPVDGCGELTPGPMITPGRERLASNCFRWHASLLTFLRKRCPFPGRDTRCALCPWSPRGCHWLPVSCAAAFRLDMWPAPRHSTHLG
jgi:hypothetical protein